MAPSVMGISYCFPVRLSVMVSVSAITASGVRVWVIIGIGIRYRIAGNPVAAIHPSGQVLVAAPFTAERPPARVHGTRPALDAQRDLAHPAYFTGVDLRNGKRAVPMEPPGNLRRWQGVIP